MRERSNETPKCCCQEILLLRTDTATRGRCKQQVLGRQSRNQFVFIYIYFLDEAMREQQKCILRQFYCITITHQLFFYKTRSRAKRGAEKVIKGSKVTYSVSSLLAVISLIWPAGEHAFKLESCLSALVTGVDRSTGTLSMNIHQFHNMPATKVFFQSHVNIKNTLSLGGVASHICDSHFSQLRIFFLIISRMNLNLSSPLLWAC